MLDKNLKILFFIERDFHITILKPLMHYILNKNISEIAVYSPFNQDIKNTLKHNLKNDYDSETSIKLLKSISIQNNPWKWKPDITFMADFSYQFVEGLGKIVNIGHGTISKGWFYSLNKISQRENCADLLCVPGEIHKERLQKQVYKKILVTGMPKLDNCFNNSIQKEQILKKFNLDPEQKTILLAPTFNEEFSILPFLNNHNINNIFPDYLNLIVKLHGVSTGKDYQVFNTLKSNRQKNIYIAENYDVDELFIASDILLSDVSSIIYEFAALNKPVILFDSPRINEYINLDKNDLEWQYRDIGYRFSDVKRIPELIFKSFTKPILNAKSIADKFISVQDGSSTKKVIEQSLALLDYAKNQNLRIFITDSNKNNSKDFIQKFADSFNINLINKEDTFSLLSKYSYSENYLLFIDSSFNISPQLPNFMLNQMKNNTNAGIVIPLISDNEVHEQQMKFKVKFQQDLDINQTGIQITYAFAGYNKSIDFPKSYCFLINMEELQSSNFNFSNINNKKNCWYELITNFIKQDKDLLLAYDCLISEIESTQTPHTQDDYTQVQETNFNQPLLNIDGQKDTFSDTEEHLLQKLYDNPHDEQIILELIKLYEKHSLWEKLDVYSDMLPTNIEAMYYGIKSLEAQNLLPLAYEKISDININCIYDIALKNNILILMAKLIMKLQAQDKSFDYKSPEEILNLVLSTDSNNIEGLITRAIYYLSNSYLDSALKDFDKVLRNEPANKKAMKGKALILQQTEDFLKASQIYRDLLKQDPEDIESLNQLVKCSWETNSFNDVVKALEEYLDFHPANLDILFTLAGIEYKLDNKQKAVELLEKILILDEDFIGAKQLMNKIKDSFY